MSFPLQQMTNYRSSGENGMYEQLLQQLNQFVILTLQQQHDLCRAVQVEAHSKGYLLLEQGQIANYIYFVVEGIIRCYHNGDRKEITRWFGLQGYFCTPYFSFVYRKPSEDSIVLVTDCTLLSISYAKLQHLFNKDPI